MKRKPKPRWPVSEAEWIEAMHLAEAWLHVDSAKKYGLITGGPEVDVGRCEQLLKEAKRRGFTLEPRRVDQAIARIVREHARAEPIS